MTVVVVTGGRKFTDRTFVEESLNRFEERINGPITAMVCGMALGVDLFCHQWALCAGVLVREFPADWNEFGESAGPRRNQQMIDENPDIEYGLVFPGKSGTADMTRRLRKAGIERVFYSPPVSLEDELSGWG